MLPCAVAPSLAGGAHPPGEEPADDTESREVVEVPDNAPDGCSAAARCGVTDNGRWRSKGFRCATAETPLFVLILERGGTESSLPVSGPRDRATASLPPTGGLEGGASDPGRHKRRRSRRVTDQSVSDLRKLTIRARDVVVCVPLDRCPTAPVSNASWRRRALLGEGPPAAPRCPRAQETADR